MADRPYRDLTSSQLSSLLSGQLKTGGRLDAVEVTTFGDANRSWLLGDTVTSQNVETTFRVGADGRPEAVTRLVASPSPTSVRNGGETELAWLRRRVSEICWRPS